MGYAKPNSIRRIEATEARIAKLDEIFNSPYITCREMEMNGVKGVPSKFNKFFMAVASQPLVYEQREQACKALIHRLQLKLGDAVECGDYTISYLPQDQETAHGNACLRVNIDKRDTEFFDLLADDADIWD